MVKKEIYELLAMFHFAEYISRNSDYSPLDLPYPITYFSIRTWSAADRLSYGNSVATYLSNMSYSDRFCDWVRGWNSDPKNTSKRQHSAEEWRVLVSRWVE